MGDIVILNEAEVQIGLSFILQSVLKKYDVVLQEMNLKIKEDHLLLTSVVLYNQYHVDVLCEFNLKYENQHFVFENIQGKVEYLFLQFPIMSFLKSFLQDSHIIWKDNQIQYEIDLPIESLNLEDGQLQITLKNNQSVSP